MRTKKPVIKESNLHQQVVDYLKYQYPKVLFRTDFAAGIKMTIGQAVKHKKLQKCKAWPDLFIAHPKNKYAGLFIEIKKSRSEVFNKWGQYKKDTHIQEQAEILRHLENMSYIAEFGCGFEDIKSIIDNYFK